MSRQNQNKTLVQLAADRLGAPEEGSRAASKYDFVKVKVWLGEDMAHYYVLSRFLISRMLTVTKVPHQKAVKIALDVKKHLVDNDRLDITQGELEAILFSVMRSKGFGDEFINRYKMVSQFFQQKRPLIILICGSACTGKSTFAQQLASRLNLPNVLQTDILYEMLRTSDWGPMSSTPLWAREGLADEELISEFQRECRTVRRGLEGDLCKCIKDGKPIIIEGLHLDPGLYMDEFGRHGMVGMAGAFSQELGQDELPALMGPPGAAADGALPIRASPALQVGRAESISESLAASPPSPSGPLSCGGSDDDAPPPLAPSNSFPPSAARTAAGCAPDSPSDADVMVSKRSASFGDAAASGLSYPSPAHSKHSPWRHLQQMYRLLHRPRSAQRPAEQQAQGAQRQANGSLAQGGAGGSPPPPPSSSPPPQQQQPLQGRGMMRTESLGQVTFMLQQEADAALAPTPVMPGTEVVVPAPAPAPASPRAGQLGGSPVIGAILEERGPGAAAAAAAAGVGSSAGACLLLTQEAPAACSNGSAEPGRGESAGSPGTAPFATGQLPTPAPPASQSRPLPAAAAATASGGRPSASPAAQAVCAAGRDAAGSAALPSTRAPPGDDAAAQPQQGPVFVPLVLRMDERDYELVVTEWQAAQAGAWGVPGGGPGGGDSPRLLGGGDAGGGGSAADADPVAVLHRLRVLQDYLCAYRSVGVPVVGVTVGSFHETLDQLHDYLLRCIQMSL